MLLLGITTKGHAEQNYWVKSYQIQTKSPNGIRYFVNYQQPYGTVKVGKQQICFVQTFLSYSMPVLMNLFGIHS